MSQETWLGNRAVVPVRVTQPSTRAERRRVSLIMAAGCCVAAVPGERVPSEADSFHGGPRHEQAQHTPLIEASHIIKVSEHSSIVSPFELAAFFHISVLIFSISFL